MNISWTLNATLLHHLQISCVHSCSLKKLQSRPISLSMIVEVAIYMPNSIQSPSIIYTSRNKWTQRKCHFEPKDKAFDTNLTSVLVWEKILRNFLISVFSQLLTNLLWPSIINTCMTATYIFFKFTSDTSFWVAKL